MIEAVSASMNVRENPPPGLLIHVATEEAEGIRIIDVWNSQADYEAFAESQLNPAIGRAAAEHGMDAPADGAQPTFVEAFDLVLGK
jgi:hypothetical protein